jgi:hypothetical protein
MSEDIFSIQSRELVRILDSLGLGFLKVKMLNSEDGSTQVIAEIPYKKYDDADFNKLVNESEYVKNLKKEADELLKYKHYYDLKKELAGAGK